MISKLFRSTLRGRESHRKLLMADAARNSRQWSEAVRLYQLFLKKEARRADIWVQLGHALKELGRIDEAELAYRRSLIMAPNCADTYVQLGHALKIRGDLADAVECYKAAYRLDLNLGSARQELLSAGIQLDTIDRHAPQSPVQGDQRPATLQLLAKGAQLRSYFDLRRAADHARGERRFGDAADLYRSFLAFAPQDAAIWVQLGHALKETGNLHDAENCYYRALRIDRGQADTFVQIGHILKLKGDRNGAIEHYKIAHQMEPSLQSAKDELAAALIAPSSIPHRGARFRA